MRPAHLLVAGLALAALPAVCDAAWGPAVRVAPPGPAVASGDVATGAGGRAVAAWLRTDRRGTRVVVSSRAAGRWTPPRALGGTGVARPRAAVNALGDAAVAWVGDRAVVAGVRRGPAGRWTTSLVARADGAVQDLRLAIDRAGRPMVLWSEAMGRDYVARVASRPSASAGWRVRPARIGTAGPVAPALALSAGAGALVAWTDGARTLASRTVGGDFEAPREVAGQASGRPAAAIGPSGAGLTAWSARLPGGTSVVQAAGRTEPGDAWGEPDDVGIGATPVAAVNEDGDAVVAWSLGGAGRPQGVESVTRTGPTGAWRSTTVVPRRSCSCTLRVAGVGVADDGTAVVAWRRDEDDGGSGGGVAALGPRAEDWDRASVGAGRPDATPAVSAAGGGATALWTSGRTGVRAATLR
ncbi:MAG TPA: hypothetical protein PKD59_17605 [Miltoncostaeaceae bacterium]|nr:hypothetical protein [Miltoncostaeaceae bacterium]